MIFESAKYNEVTKYKSLVVEIVLRKGVHVTWSDPDVVWFNDPIPTLLALKSDFVIQNDLPLNVKRRKIPVLNSGFYRVRATPVTIAAFADLNFHQQKISKTYDQISFGLVLCGNPRQSRAIGLKACFYSSKTLNTHDAAAAPALEFPGGVQPVNPYKYPLTTANAIVIEALDQMTFPNGIVRDLWSDPELRAKSRDMFVLHNNWIVSQEAKVQRQIKKGLWFYVVDRMVCSYDLLL